MIAVAPLAASASGESDQHPHQHRSGRRWTGSAPAAENLDAEKLAALPAAVVRIKTSFLTEQGTHEASFEGPLLWAVLEKTGAIDPASGGSIATR